MKKVLLCLDFDGVIHSYTSGWKGADVIPDPPVKEPATGICALQRIREYVSDPKIELCINSARSSQPGGIEAMKAWLFKQGLELKYLDKIKFPKEKPPAHLTIDDRVMCFQGFFPEVKFIKEFKPWFQR